MTTIVYSEPHQVRSNCGPDPYVAKHSGRGLPRYMTGVMDDLAYNGGSTPPNPARFVIRSSTVASTTSIIINWTLPLFGGTTRTGFKLFITQTNVAPVPSGTGITVGPTVATNTFTGLTNGQTYYVWVYAQASSTYSSVATSGALLLDAVPNIPTSFGLGTVTDTSIEITWQNPGIGGGDTLYFLTTYSLTNSAPDPFTAPNVQQIALGVGTATFTGLTASTVYYLWVWAINLSGKSNPLYSSTSTNAPPVLPDAPTGLLVNNETSNSATVNWTWGTPNPGTVMLVYIQLSDLPVPIPGTTPTADTVGYSFTQTTISPLLSGTRYYTYIVPYDGVTLVYGSIVGSVSFVTLI